MLARRRFECSHRSGPLHERLYRENERKMLKAREAEHRKRCEAEMEEEGMAEERRMVPRQTPLLGGALICFSSWVSPLP